MNIFLHTGLPPGRETSGRLFAEVEQVVERRQLGRLDRLDRLAHRRQQEQPRTSPVPLDQVSTRA